MIVIAWVGKNVSSPPERFHDVHCRRDPADAECSWGWTAYLLRIEVASSSAPIPTRFSCSMRAYLTGWMLNTRVRSPLRRRVVFIVINLEIRGQPVAQEESTSTKWVDSNFFYGFSGLVYAHSILLGITFIQPRHSRDSTACNSLEGGNIPRHAYTLPLREIETRAPNRPLIHVSLSLRGEGRERPCSSVSLKTLASQMVEGHKYRAPSKWWVNFYKASFRCVLGMVY